MNDSMKFQRLAEVMTMVASDCEAEAMALDQTPFDKRGVGEQFGNMLAEIKACAIGVRVCAETLAVMLEEPS